ncbi:MAG: hypothetical protein JEZ04_12250 [Spirochaetales bacterium]|nr:hypothetical protein [Spirochaetales bacterium]
MKKIILLSLLCFFLVFSLAAEEKSVYDEFDQALGGYYGDIGGWGISYQQWFGPVGFETAAGFAYDSQSTFAYVIGAQMQFMLYQDYFSEWFSGSLYFFTGGLHGGTVSDTGYEPSLGFGLGIGFEPVFFEHFSTPIEFGYGGSWTLDSIIPTAAGVRVQGGFRYRF